MTITKIFSLLHKPLGFLLLVFSLGLLTAPAFVEARESVEQTNIQKDIPNENELDSHNHYVSKDGHTVHSPSKSKSGSIPDGASAKCRDGSYSFSQHRSGTCSHHGGVGQWF